MRTPLGGSSERVNDSHGTVSTLSTRLAHARVAIHQVHLQKDSDVHRVVAHLSAQTAAAEHCINIQLGRRVKENDNAEYNRSSTATYIIDGSCARAASCFLGTTVHEHQALACLVKESNTKYSPSRVVMGTS